MNFFWNISYWVIKFIFNFFGNLEIKVDQKAKINSPVIIIANHLSYLDGFLLGLVIKEVYPEITPIRFMVKKEFDFFPIGTILKWYGAFFVDTKAPLKATRNALEIILKKEGSLGIFPEGRRSSGKLLPFKKGVEYLSQKSGALVLPIVILGTYVPGSGFWSFWKKFFLFLTRKYKIKVFVGLPFKSNIEENYKKFYESVGGEQD